MHLQNRFKYGAIILLCLCFGGIGFPIIAGGTTYKLPEARFLNDSIKIGGQVKLVLSYKHKPEQEFLFPDSAYDFSPFEFVSKDFFLTRSDSITSVDSVIYTLTTFEMEPKLGLSLPVYIFEGGDTAQLYSDEAGIYLSEVIAQVTPSDSLKVNTVYKTLNTRFNYPYLLVGSGILVLLAGIVLVFFRKTIVRIYRSFLMKKDYEKFIKNFDNKKLVYQSQQSTSILEEMLSLWKRYLQKLEKTPYTTLTTKEISKIFDYNQLTSSLQNFDRAIYGGRIGEDLSNSVNCLQDTATQRYSAKQEEMRHA